MEVINKSKVNYCAWTVSDSYNGLYGFAELGVSCREGEPVEWEDSYFDEEGDIAITHCILCNKKIKLVDEADYEDHCFMLNQGN